MWSSWEKEHFEIRLSLLDAADRTERAFSVYWKFI